MLDGRHRLAIAHEGYIVVSGLVPKHLLKAARDFICSSVCADLSRPDTWYRHDPLDRSVVPVHHAQPFWDIRQWPAVHQVFAKLLGTEKLWVSMDRAIFKVPLSDRYPQHIDDSALHWDIEPGEASATSYQGMLFLTEADRGAGCFECVPSIYRSLEHYMRAHPGPLVDVPLDLAGFDVVEVPTRAGDLVIWDARLPHHGGRNRGARPRVSLALTMFPEGQDADRAERIACWQQKRAPSWWRGWRGQLDPEPGERAYLTPLGRRIVGVDSWP